MKRISTLGEFGLIEKIKKLVKNSSSVFKGIGDDCAVVDFDRDKFMLLSCDMLIEGADFKRNASPYLIGRKAIASSISDIASAGGLSKYALVALGLPENKSERFVKELYRGMSYWAKKFKIDIVGGDISKSKSLVIDICMVGMVEKEKLVLRSGAKLNDIIFVTGRLGNAIKGKHFTFKPRQDEAAYLVANYKINSMIDISDGLTQDLTHILKISNCGAVLYEKLIPLSRGCRNKVKALYGGEEFELLFTLAPNEARRLINSKRKIYSPIGQIIDQKNGLRLIGRDFKDRPLAPGGYCHF